jgi:hypothetical protein
MQHYISQLINDIRQATWNLQPPHSLWEESEADPDNELELEDMSFIEQYVEGERQPISQITGISSEQLPPPDKLNIEQCALLASELEKLLEYFHFRLDFPMGYPYELRYKFIRDFWVEEHVLLSFGENHIEFCDYNEENCPFPGYCNTCKEIAGQMKFDEEEAGSVDFEINLDNLLPDAEQIKAWKNQQENFIPEEDFSSSFPFEPDEDENVYPEEINGFYDDNGNKIEPESVQVPGLCIVCKKYLLDDWDENLLCLMNRYDQRNDDSFECGAFQSI